VPVRHERNELAGLLGQLVRPLSTHGVERVPVADVPAQVETPEPNVIDHAAFRHETALFERHEIAVDRPFREIDLVFEFHEARAIPFFEQREDLARPFD